MKEQNTALVFIGIFAVILTLTAISSAREGARQAKISAKIVKLEQAAKDSDRAFERTLNKLIAYEQAFDEIDKCLQKSRDSNPHCFYDVLNEVKK